MRIFTPYEQNQLKKHKVSLAKAQGFGDRPVEYITGFAEFCGHEFIVTPDVLIPRVETAQMIDIALSTINDYSDETNRPLTFTDVGCGSGAIGISLFLELQKKKINCQMYLSDVSQKALRVTKTNVKRLIPKKFQKNITVLKSNLLTQYPKQPLPSEAPRSLGEVGAKGGQPPKFDFIVANLPYIPSSRLPLLSPAVKNYEPLLALDGGPDGLQLIKQLIYQSTGFLKSKPEGLKVLNPSGLIHNGVLILEINNKHKISDFAEFTNFKKEIKKDCFGRNRFLLLHRRL